MTVTFRNILHMFKTVEENEQGKERYRTHIHIYYTIDTYMHIEIYKSHFLR